MANEAVTPGQILAGKYSVERVLGTGAMGMVLAATHLALGTRVAIKIMLGGGKQGAEHTARFLREARVAAALRSQHAGKVLDVGMTEAGAPYIVMEFLDGEDLTSALARRGPLSMADAIDYILQACEAIAEAHGLGIIHRDIKPANLFLTTGVDGAPCVKVVDFGIAKQTDDQAALTQTGAAMGSPLYMSPEQMRGARDVDARADVWALGVTLYQLLANAVPFQAETLVAVVSMVNLDPPTPLRQHRPDLPPGLGAVIEQCLEKDRTRRFPDVATLAAALAPFATARAAGYVERVASVQHSAVMPSRPTTELPRPPETAPQEPSAAMALAGKSMAMTTPLGGGPRRASTGLVIGATLAGLIAVAGGFALYVSARSSAPASATQPAPSDTPTAIPSPTTIAPALPASNETTAPSVTAAPAPSAIPSGSAPAVAATPHIPAARTAPKPRRDPYAQ
jgi:serine/threonine-protein kinase